jgi:hypothetical protein
VKIICERSLLAGGKDGNPTREKIVEWYREYNCFGNVESIKHL